jgi:hypothetical protein
MASAPSEKSCIISALTVGALFRCTACTGLAGALDTVDAMEAASVEVETAELWEDSVFRGGAGVAKCPLPATTDAVSRMGSGFWAGRGFLARFVGRSGLSHVGSASAFRFLDVEVTGDTSAAAILGASLAWLVKESNRIPFVSDQQRTFALCA